MQRCVTRSLTDVIALRAPTLGEIGSVGLLCFYFVWYSEVLYNLFVQNLVAEVDARRTLSKRRRLGRPPRRWEAPLVNAFGNEWFRHTRLGVVELGHGLGV